MERGAEPRRSAGDGLRGRVFRLRVDAPPQLVYERWSHLERFPQMTRSVRRVRRLDEDRTLWHADVAGRAKVWEARIVKRDPGHALAWSSHAGAVNNGEVRFRESPSGGTELEVLLRVRPRGLVERLGVLLGVLDAQVESDLACIRRHLERAAEREGAPPAQGVDRSAPERARNEEAGKRGGRGS